MALSESSTWYLERLRSMSAAEIIDRIAEQIKRAAHRSDRRVYTAFQVGDGALPIIPGLADDITAAAPAGLETVVHEASRAARALPFSFLGRQWPVSARDEAGRLRGEAWLLDPISGDLWEGRNAYCFDVNYRSRRDRGDVKYVWELNRLQFLQPIAVDAARRAERADGVAWIMDTARSWMAANPPFRGINWASGIELGLRVVSLTVAISALGIESFAEDQRRDLRAFLNAHVYWIARFPSRHSSANNHLIIEALALFLVGLLMPDLAMAPRWEAIGRATLEREVTRQIMEDGVGAEQSPTYTAFTVEAYLLAIHAAGRMQRPLSQTVIDRVALAARYLCWIMDEGGHVAEIGDNDAGRIIATGTEPELLYPASIASATAAVTGAWDVAPPQCRFELRQLIFGTSPRAPSQPLGLQTFPAGGYTVWRGGLGNHQAILIFDTGPVGYLSIAAHGHADVLSIWLHLDDLPIVVDAGTFLYHSGGEWREYFRSTAAHNSLTAGGRSSSTPSGSFNWRRKAVGRLVRTTTSDGAITLVGEHDGYVRELHARHQRTVAVLPGRGLTVTDVLDGAVDLDVELGLNIHPALSVNETPSGYMVAHEGRDVIFVRGPTDFSGRLLRGCETPRAGWYSPHFGVKAPLTRISFRGRLGGDRRATTIVDVCG